jgi:type II secretory pathway pseudopilin PulG
MEVKKAHKIRGFLSIELMLVLTVVAIFGGISLYVGKRVIDRAKVVAMDVEAQMLIAVLLQYRDTTGRWPIITRKWVSIRAVALELRQELDRVLLNNPYTANSENPREFPNIWIRMDGQPNRWGEDVLTELQRLTQRPVLENEIRVFEGVRYFFPMTEDLHWVWSTEGDVVNGEYNGDNVGTN